MKKKELKRRKKIIYDVISAKNYKPMKIKEIATLLQIPKAKRPALEETLEALIADGLIIQTKRGKYCKPETELQNVRKTDGSAKAPKMGNRVRGVFMSHPKGYGFVTPEESDFSQDIFIPEAGVGDAFHMDIVEVQLTEAFHQGRRMEGRILRVVEHQLKEIVGTYEQSRNYGFVVPDLDRVPQDIFIPKEWTCDATDGDKVIALISRYGGRGKSPEGRIRKVLGKKGMPGIDVMSVAMSYGLPMEFSEKVLHQAERVKQYVQEADLEGRKDLRSMPCVTIDGEDAKDLDDAVTIKKTEEGYELGVHIADVSNYVQAGSALDREALRRGTSVYLVDRVIPMLPTELSNGICSLNQGEDRLTLSCLMKINEKGKIIAHELCESVIRVDQRMTYTAVQGILDGNEAVCSEYEDFVELFHLMRKVSGLLRDRRRKRGAIDFDFPESKVLLDSEGHPTAIKAYEHNEATDLIEDFMLAANETIAKEFSERDLPFVYRIHEEPDEEKMESVIAFARAHNISVEKKKQKMSPKEIQQLLASVQDDATAPILSRLTLRSMKQARYSVDDVGHYGLAAKHYCHFTSPIRRYSDLQIHRIIKDMLRGRLNEDKQNAYEAFLEDVAVKCSTAERRAEETERETVKMKKAEYMLSHIGEEFNGIVNGLTSWGMYVMLDNTVEGLVSMNALRDDYYLFDEEAMELVGERFGKIYRLGDTVRIVVESADVNRKTIDFSIADEN